MNRMFGGGFRGRGRGFGRGLGYGFRGGRWAAGAYPPAYGPPPVAPPDPRGEREALQGQVEYLEGVLDGIRKRIGELERAKGDEK
jgi:hypothetical protein